MLRAASVFGQVFWRGGVAALLGGDARPTGSREWLAELVERELIARARRRAFPGEDEYAFRHALVREAAYAMLTEADRALGHRLAGEWLERAGERDAVVARRALRARRRAARARRAGTAAPPSRRSRATTSTPPSRGPSAGIACGAAERAAGALALVEAEAHRWRGELADRRDHAPRGRRLLPRRSPAWFRAATEAVVAAGRLGDRRSLEGSPSSSSRRPSRPRSEPSSSARAWTALCAHASAAATRRPTRCSRSSRAVAPRDRRADRRRWRACTTRGSRALFTGRLRRRYFRA